MSPRIPDTPCGRWVMRLWRWFLRELNRYDWILWDEHVFGCYVCTWRVGWRDRWTGRQVKTMYCDYWYHFQNGYAVATLCRNGKRTTFYVHRLVLEAFVGLCPEGMECCHADGDRANSRLDNLRWDTPKNNHADKVRHGNHLYGETNGYSKVTEPDVRAIRARCAAGETHKAVAIDFGISRENVGCIARRETWTHI